MTVRWRQDRTAPDMSAPERVRHALEEMGPTFVKLGQILSTRVDLFAPARNRCRDRCRLAPAAAHCCNRRTRADRCRPPARRPDRIDARSLVGAAARPRPAVQSRYFAGGPGTDARSRVRHGFRSAAFPAAHCKRAPFTARPRKNRNEKPVRESVIARRSCLGGRLISSAT